MTQARKWGDVADELTHDEDPREDELIEVRRGLLRHVLDVATMSMDFGSGFLTDDQVAVLREAAELVGIDPAPSAPHVSVVEAPLTDEERQTIFNNAPTPGNAGWTLNEYEAAKHESERRRQARRELQQHVTDLEAELVQLKSGSRDSERYYEVKELLRDAREELRSTDFTAHKSVFDILSS